MAEHLKLGSTLRPLGIVRVGQAVASVPQPEIGILDNILGFLCVA